MRRLALVLLGVALVAGCGGKSAGTAASPPTPVQAASPSPSAMPNLGPAYLAAVANVNAAITAFNAKLPTINTAVQAKSASAPLIAALQQVEGRLARIPFTGQSATDVRTLISASASVRADLSSLATVDAFNESTFVAAFNKDIAQLGSAVTVVRADLGLPASS